MTYSGPTGPFFVAALVTDFHHWPLFDTLYALWVGNHRPARAVVPVPVVHHGFLLEVEAVAAMA